jgi:hypothetical protein
VVFHSGALPLLRSDTNDELQYPSVKERGRGIVISGV